LKAVAALLGQGQHGAPQVAGAQAGDQSGSQVQV
jgi:hypothetical protein